MGEVEVEVPSYFLCPISLELMKDPVTVSTGITYDRESIEKWLFSGKNNTCPTTKQVITDADYLIPNVTLRRLIQSWCTLNAAHGYERIPTPKPIISKVQIVKIVNEAKKATTLNKLNCLKRLRSIASENATNKRCIESSGAVEFLVSIVCENSNLEQGRVFEPSLTDEALSILHNLQLSESKLKSFSSEFVECLIRVMQIGSYESRAYTILLLKSILEVSDPMRLINLRSEIFLEIVQVLRDQISTQSTKVALLLLVQVLPWGRNRIKAIESDAVSMIIELLMDSMERRTCEILLTILDMLCSTAEGRAELLKHGGGLAVVSKKILRVSQVASERAVKILLNISKYSGTPWVVQEMVQVGVVTKLCLVIQVDVNGSKTSEKAREILRLHARTWKNSPCLPNAFFDSYPA
ncbi:hypothetical protein ACFE04_001973 [Oxalis oulophora]